MSKAKREIGRGVCMTLELKNIGMIKEANVKIDGLTVIAGENDTGKSTLGKVLYGLIQSISWASNTYSQQDSNYKNQFTKQINDIFDKQLASNGEIKFHYEGVDFGYKIIHNSCSYFSISQEFHNGYSKIGRPLLIETPFIWTIHPLLKTIQNLKAHDVVNDIDFEIVPTLKDLYFALTTKRKEKKSFNFNIEGIIGGHFEEDNLSGFIFNKGGEKIKLVNTAMGIKYFGLLQVLENNNYLYNGQVLILDEPEVHLHPKWQLEMAKIIVELVKNGVKILVNSHSPYMIEALQRYSELEKVNSDFYLAEDGYINKVNSNAQTLEKIFEKLSEPFDVFEEMDSQSMEKLING